jgi:hypothetical protein
VHALRRFTELASLWLSLRQLCFPKDACIHPISEQPERVQGLLVSNANCTTVPKLTIRHRDMLHR